MTEPLSIKKKVTDVLPPSIRRGIQELIKQFLVMEHSLLSGDEFVKQIHESIETFFLVLEEAYSDDDINFILLSQLDGIEDGIAFIRGAITNRLHAGRYLYEPVFFNPHNMGPFSKLYLFYEKFVDLFEDLISGYNKLKNGSTNGTTRLSLLVDISIYSSVHAQSFVPQTSKEIPDNVLVGITINEHAFFQIHATMVWLLHEIGHYVRPFDRRKRNIALRDIVFAWLTNMVYRELEQYLDLEIKKLQNSPKGVDKTEQEKIDLVTNHFAQEIFPIIDPILIKSLTKHFNNSLKSASDVMQSGDHAYESLLDQFHNSLDTYLIDLSIHLSMVLFSAKETPKDSNESPLHPTPQVLESPIKSIIVKLLNGTDIPADKEYPEPIIANLEYFSILSETSTSLFKEGKFSHKVTTDDMSVDRVGNAYLACLSTLGLNEPDVNNLKHFSNILLQCMKKAIETMKHEEVLDMLIYNLKEALAHLFWIRTLDIRSFKAYWAIMEPLIDQTALSPSEKIRLFGIPNAIITEYFNKIEKRSDSDLIKYEISPINTVQPGTWLPSKPLLYSKDDVVEEMRQMVLIPMGTYISEENDVFPEEQLFRSKIDGTTSSQRKLIENLRERYKEFIQDVDGKDHLSQEMQIIDFFSNTDKN